MNESSVLPETPEELRSLRELVTRREVCWDVFQEVVRFQGRNRTVGYELSLSGIHTAGAGEPMPGCRLCKEVFEDLRRVARFIIPREERPSIHEISMYDAAIRRSRERHHRPEVSLSIKILHRHGFENPIDACEQRCLREMENRLRTLGACQGEWKPVREPVAPR